jgi:hypothetical protein
LGGDAVAGLDDGLRDLGSDRLAEFRGAAAGGLRAIADEAALDEDGGEAILAQYAEVGGHDAAIERDCAKAIGNGLGHGGGHGRVVVNSCAVNGPGWAVVEMNAYVEEV